jgi:hypothetical protein
MWTADVRAWSHPGQAHFPHQPLYPFTIDGVADSPEKNHHLAAAIKGMPGVFLVDQVTDQQIAFINIHRELQPVNR